MPNPKNNARGGRHEELENQPNILAEEQDMAFEADTFLEGYLKMCAIVLDKSDNSS